MSSLFDCRDESQLLAGLRHARAAIGRGELIVMPTDTVYGIAADAFSPAAVAALLAAKGRGRQSPPPVLVAGLTTVRALVSDLPEPIERLVEAHWPGGLTVVLPAQPSLSWDLGDTGGTVAVRMPAHRLALELLEETGPLAVSSANLTGKAAAVSISEAQAMLGDSVSVYLDDGPSTTGVPSTIVDATGLAFGAGGVARILRDGVIGRDHIRAILGDAMAPDEYRDGDAEPTEAEKSRGGAADDTSAAPESPAAGDGPRGPA